MANVSHTQSYSFIQNISTALKLPIFPFLLTIDLSYCAHILPFEVCGIIIIIQYVAFSEFTWQYIRLFHVLFMAWKKISLIIKNPIVWLHHSEFIHVSTEGHLVASRFGQLLRKLPKTLCAGFSVFFFFLLILQYWWSNLEPP